MQDLINQPQNRPFYNEVSAMNLAELKRFGNKVIKEFKDSIKLLELSNAKDLELLSQIQDTITSLLTRAHALGIMEMFHPDKDFRDLSSEFSIRLSTVINGFNLNQKIYKKYSKNIDPTKLDQQASYLYEQTMDSYKRSGVDKPKEIRQQINKLMDEMSELANKFSKNIAENTPKIELEKEKLEGCFNEFIQSNTKNDGKIEITLVSNSVLHILHNCKIKSTREKVREINLNAAKDSNWNVLPAYLNKAEELAKLIGFNNYAELSMQDKMIENPQKAEDFIKELLALTKQRVQKEIKLIKQYKLKSNDTTELSYADIDYYGNQIATKISSLNEEELKKYFPYEHVRKSILEVFEEMFNIKFKLHPTAKIWHKDVQCYQVIKEEKTIGIIYLDMHPRDGKFNHACSIDIIPGIKNKTIPQNILLCNFNKPDKQKPGLQSLDEVSTFFHEFGHLLHGILGGQEVAWLELSGTSVQQDFVESPSQLLEEILMDQQVLKRLTKHIETKQQIPDDFIKAIQNKESIFDKAKLKGIGIARQASLSEQSLKAYTTKKINNNLLTDLEQNSSKKAIGVYGNYYSLYNFGHLTDYASNYYTYMWSLAISKDLFTRFNHKNLLDRKVAKHYQETILEPGGSKPAAELVKDFLGREWNMNAFKEYLKDGESLLKQI